MRTKAQDIVIEVNFGELMPNQTVKQEVVSVTYEGELLDPANTAQREKYIGRIEVLEKVGGLLLLPNMEVATTKQVAQFYDVSHQVLTELIKRHGDELKEDGMYLAKYGEIKAEVKKDSLSLLELGVSYRGTNLYPRRAILRVGMLLRDSAVAKEVRTQLLNIEGNTGADVKMMDVNEEMQLQMAVGQAFALGDTAALLQATAQMMEFKNRHITQVSEERDEYKAELDTINGKDLISLKNIGLEYLEGVSSVKLRKFLQGQGVLSEVRTDGHYTANLKYAKYFKLSTTVKNARLCKTLKATREGASFIAERYEKHNAEKSA
ncbi:hypothetical protein CN425_12970 [Bacillus cereus]|uniref:Antirepressor protein C-terminal domain-containing protein n=1 Tax=Bacillus cereus TaxID=1396 RepID=A0A2A8PW10_BACCE|nr:hypothetical protein [Bacillus cereus]PEW01519.1 hypothetical protein CN425_12970 [Bacillus cereus]